MPKLSRRKKGFTLIEVLVVIAIIVIALPTIFAILYAIVRAQARVFVLKQIKREGDYVINQISNQVRNNAVGIYSDRNLLNEVCDRAGLGTNPYSNDGNSFFFKNREGQWFSYYLDRASVASQASVLAPVDLTSNRVDVTNFTITCNRSGAYSPPIITLAFDINYHLPRFQEQLATINYQTQITMKNY